MGVDVGAWLRGLGLGQYEQAFCDNDVDARVLPGLTTDDLKDLGVTSIGHRRLILQAIAEGSAALPPATSAPPRPERRQLTVMFVDLVGSTELSRRLDPEEMGELLRAYQHAVADAVERFEGHVAKYMGDGVLAYFGWPRAHEDAAERAVRAALATVEAVGRIIIQDAGSLAARVGVATGLVLVGDLIGEGAAREEVVIGETPNLAARLQGIAEAGMVVVAEGTRRLLGSLFEMHDLGHRQLQGFSHAVRTWQVVGPGAAASRFEALHEGGLAPLVGREEEIALLLERWHQARDGEGQVVLLSGEPGIGKSHLVQALREHLQAEPCVSLSYFCSPLRQTSALYPVIDLLERAAAFARDDPLEAKIAKLEVLLARGAPDVTTTVPLLAALLSIPTGGRYPPLDLGPQRLKERIFEVLLDHMAGLAASQSVLALYEDVQWSDPTTLELIELVMDRAQSLPVLVIVTFRPDFAPPWRGRAHATWLTLNRLSRKRAAAIVTGVAGGRTLPTEILEQILARTDGVPLFLEELTKAVLEAGLLREVDDRYELVAGGLAPLTIPTTLHDSLLARLDRLAPVKEVAQVGAVIGRAFSHELLAAVAPLAGDELDDALGQLAAAELVFRQGAPPRAIYVFKHALVRDTAYQSLPRGRRQQLHAQIAQVLVERFPEQVETEPELVALHRTEAGLAAQAADDWLRAGRRALARSATAEAVAQLTRGLDLLPALPDGPERWRRELDLQVALGSALIAAKGFAAPETSRAYARTHELCMVAGDTTRIFPALFGRFVVHFHRAELAAAHEVARELLRLAEEQGDVAAQVVGHRIVGAALFQLGRLAESREHLEQGLRLYEPARDRTSGLVYATDSRVVCLHWLSHALLTLGYPEQAEARAVEALAHARELARPNTLADALCCACTLYARLRRRQEAQAHAEEVVALTTKQGFPLWLARGRSVRGWALVDGGHVEEGIAELRQGLADYAAAGADLWSTDFLALLAEVHWRAGQATTGLALLADALARAEVAGGRWLQAELHHLKGELLLALPDPDPAEAEVCFRRAEAIARGQDARMLELRAATSLGRLWRDQGRQAEACDLLAPIYGWFIEGFDTPDLIEARTLLEELRGTPAFSPVSRRAPA
jgi:predicted ATPase/class 3 adenylate cyclase